MLGYVVMSKDENGKLVKHCYHVIIDEVVQNGPAVATISDYVLDQIKIDFPKLKSLFLKVQYTFDVIIDPDPYR